MTDNNIEFALHKSIKEIRSGYKKFVSAFDISKEQYSDALVFLQEALDGIDFKWDDPDDIIELVRETVRANHLDAFNLFLKHGFDVNMINSEYEPVFAHRSAPSNEFCSKLDFVKAAYEAGADFSKKQKYGEDLYYQTLQSNHAEATELFIYLMQLPLAKNLLYETYGHSADGKMLFHQAIAKCKKEEAQAILNAGFDINTMYTHEYCKKFTTQNALHMVCTGTVYVQQSYSFNRVERIQEIISFLIEHGIDPNAVNSDGYTALHLTVKKSFNEHSTSNRPNDDISMRLHIFEILKHAGADINKTCNGVSPLFLAFDSWPFYKQSRFDPMINKLMELGANVDITSDNGTAIIHRAAAVGNIDLLKKCAQEGVDINQKNNKGQTPLHLACENDNPDKAVMALVRMGAEINAVNNEGETIIEILSKKGNARLIEFLLK